MEYSQERIDDLMKTYDNYIEECKHISMPNVYEEIVKKPSRRFWVSDIRAALVVSAIIRGEKVLDNMWETKQRMYKEIHRRVLIEKEKYPKKSVSELCSIVVAQPAPEFYLSPGSAKMMICKSRKDWVRRKWKRLRLL